MMKRALNRIIGKPVFCLMAFLLGVCFLPVWANDQSPVVTDRKLLSRVCSQCHATEIDGRCVAGDCRKGRIQRTKSRDWNLAIDYMVESIGCEMTRKEEKVITEYLIRHHPGKEYPLTWTEVFTTPAGSGWNIVSLRSWGDHLYAGTEGGGRILRSGDGISWEEVADTGNDKAYGLTVFKGALFTGTYGPEPQVWRSVNGKRWDHVATLPFDQTGINSLGVYKGRLYAGTGAARVYRSTDGIRWEEATVFKEVKRASWPHWVRFLVEFRGKLITGLEGGGIYVTNDGAAWSEVDVPMQKNAGVRGVAIFKDHLYIGTTGTGEIWRTKDVVQWEEVLGLGTGRGYSAAMAVFNEALYASMNEEVLRSFDGRHWETVGEITPKTIEAMAVYHGELYAGTTRPPGAQVFRTTGLTPSRIQVPDRDLPVTGKVSGSYVDIQTGHHLYQVLQERLVNGTSALEHQWTISHPGGSRLRLAVRSHHAESPDGDEFVFSYSTDGKNYTDLFHLTSTAEGRSYLYADLPSLPEGTLILRLRDTNRTKGNTHLDTVHIDHLYLLVEG